MHGDRDGSVFAAEPARPSARRREVRVPPPLGRVLRGVDRARPRAARAAEARRRPGAGARPARQEPHDRVRADPRALRPGAQPALAELGQGARRRVDRHRGPVGERTRRGGVRPRLHLASRLDGRHQRRQARAADLHGGRARHPACRHERLRRRVRARGGRRARRLQRGVHRAAADLGRGALHQPDVRLQRGRRRVSAPPGLVHDPVRGHLHRAHRPGRGEVGAGRGRVGRRARRAGRARAERRVRPHHRRRGRLAAHRAAAAHLPAEQQPRARAVRADQRSARPLHARGGHPLPQDVRLARGHERAARHHAVPAADRRPRRVLRAAARARAT